MSKKGVLMRWQLMISMMARACAREVGWGTTWQGLRKINYVREEDTVINDERRRL